MRNPNSATQNPFILRTTGFRYSLLAAMLPITFSIVLCGCSQLQKPTSFKPMPQPNSLTQRQQRPVEQILERQDEIRKVAAQEAAEAAKKAAAEAAAEASELESQQQDIVAEAAERAETLETDFQVAQVSFETAIESEEAPAVEDNPAVEGSLAEAIANEALATTSDIEFPGSLETGEAASNVKLIANADDMEGLPVNLARNEFDFSNANFLRPSDASTVEQPTIAEDASTEDQLADEVQPPSFGNAESLSLPLQPMLFNPNTRTRKSMFEGTLRPLKPTTQEFEPNVEIDRTTDLASQATPPIPDTSADSTNSFGPLSPLRKEASTIKLQPTTLKPEIAFTSTSRLLSPIVRNAKEVNEPPAMETTTAPEFVQTPSEPIIVSEEIIMVDPVREPEVTDAPKFYDSKMEAPKMEAPVKPIEPAVEENQFPGQPVVDETLAQASASYLVPAQRKFEADEEAFIPAEVFDDAIVVAKDMERELSAAAIPVEEIESEYNQFKVQATSNTTVANTPITSVCAGCGSESCSGCVDHEDRGEPMFANNDFAEPATPGGEFVAPMEIAPAMVPDAVPDQIIAASSDFGKPVNLEAPPETDSTIAHVASLPITRQPSALPLPNSNVPPVGISTLMELNAVTWKSRLDEAIELAAERLNRVNQPSDAGIVNLRLLKALRGQMEQVENAPVNGKHSEYTETESRYWQHQLEAITTMLGSPAGQNQAVTDYHRHQTAHETLEHLRIAVAQLESIASLKVNSGQFCTEITGFGQFRTFPSNVFAAGQKMLVYCEVENYKTEQNRTATGNDFRTRLRGSFAIYDATGKVVQQAEFPTVDDIARKRRRDFYMYMPVTLGDLPAGQYVLHALVEDIYGNKTASLDPPLKFSVK